MSQSSRVPLSRGELSRGEQARGAQTRNPLARRLPSRRRKITLWVIAAVVALLLFVVLWVTIRALLARDQLTAAVPLAHTVAADALSGKTDSVQSGIAELQRRADTAASLTSDPIWRMAETVPILGENLTAFRQAAQMVDDVATEALPPLGELATEVTVDSLTPKNGRYNLQAFADAAPLLSAARSALDSASASAAEIDTADTISQLGSAVDQLIDLVDDTKVIVSGLDTAASVMPAMLGADGHRSYLLLSLNNAELRATGGIPGAIAVISADDGLVTLGETTTAASIGEMSEPVLELSDAEKTLYGEILGTYMQDVTFTPDFARSGALASAMWEKRTGDTVDGVIAVDPVALSYLLKATGTVRADGVSITADNATGLLLSAVYARFRAPEQQDDFFASVTKAVFGALTDGKANPNEMIGALTRSADEQRIHVWSSHPNEQRQLDGTRIAGSVPKSSATTSAFGVYFNDATGAKMDYYLKADVSIASAVCRTDRRPNYAVSVVLKSDAPADAATLLPAYVTGGGAFGVPAGTIKTNLYLYAPDNSIVYAVMINGDQHAFTRAQHDDSQVLALTVDLAPGEEADVDIRLLGTAGMPTAATIEHTPMASAVQTSTGNFLEC